MSQHWCEILFWLSIGGLVYIYLGYFVLIWTLSRCCERPLHTHPYYPSVSIIIAVRNEENALERRIANLRRLRYDAAKIQVIIASDGSTDATARILLENREAIMPVIREQHHGKAVALNAAVELATGEILAFFDVRQDVDEEAIMELVIPFSDSSVGAVSGSLQIDQETGTGTHAALGRYWHFEKAIRALESVSGSCIGTTGAIYAIRRELYTPMPQGTILDDVFIPMHVALRRKRVIFNARATARDAFSQRRGREFARKVRTLMGNLQLVTIAPWLVTIRNPLLFRFVSHKMLRLVSPFLLVVILIASIVSDGPLYKTAFKLQIVFYCCAGLAAAFPIARKIRAVGFIYTFVSLNLAALVAFFRFIFGWRSAW